MEDLMDLIGNEENIVLEKKVKSTNGKGYIRILAVDGCKVHFWINATDFRHDVMVHMKNPKFRDVKMFSAALLSRLKGRGYQVQQD